MVEYSKLTTSNDLNSTMESKTSDLKSNLCNLNLIDSSLTNEDSGIIITDNTIRINDVSPTSINEVISPYMVGQFTKNYFSNYKTEIEQMNTENTNNAITTATELITVKVPVDIDPITPQIDKALNNNLFDQINEQGVYFPDIVDIKYNDGTTIVTFDDKTKVIVKTSKHDKFSYEQGLVYAIVKRLFGFYDETGEFKTEGFSRLLNEIVNSGYDLNQKKTVDEIVNSEKYKKLKEKEEKEQEKLQKIRDNHFIKKIKRQARKDAKRNAEYSKFYDKYYKEYLEEHTADKKETEKNKKSVREIIVE